MGFATVFASIMFAFIFASMILFAAMVQKNMTEAAGIEHQRDQLAMANSASEISIEQASYTTNMTTPWKETLYADFAGTNTDTTILTAGSVALANAPTNGTYTSQVIDTGFSSAFYNDLSWTSVEPLNTDIHFQVRTGTSVLALQAAAFVGPDGTSNTYYGISGTTIHTNHNGERYFQYKAYLDTNSSSTPELQEVTLDIARGVGVTTLVVTNSGIQKLVTNQTDVYFNGQRISRAVTERTLTLDDVAGQALWDPRENLTIYVFGNKAPGVNTITVANGPARSEAVI